MVPRYWRRRCSAPADSLFRNYGCRLFEWLGRSLPKQSGSEGHEALKPGQNLFDLDLDLPGVVAGWGADDDFA